MTAGLHPEQNGQEVDGLQSTLSFGKPRGFRDRLFSEAARREKLISELSAYFARAEYELVETPSVEYPETLLRGQSVNGAQKDLRDTFRFVDVDGNLIALRSDVTGSLARVVASRFSLVEPPYRLRYVADVFREQESLRGSERQLTQLGLECFGLAPESADTEVLSLALGGLEAIGLSGVRLHLSTVSIFSAILEACPAKNEWKQSFLSAWGNGDFIAIKKLCRDGSIPSRDATAIQGLLNLRGGAEVFAVAEQLLSANKRALTSLRELELVYTSLMQICDSDAEQSATEKSAQKLVIDFSLTPHFEYYSGMIFEIYATAPSGHGSFVGSGGRYDGLMKQFGRPMPAAGFSYDLASLEALDASCTQGAGVGLQDANSNTQGGKQTPPLRIAVPKGKLYEECIDLLGLAGVELESLRNPGRSLRIANDEYEIIIAKPTDVAIYVSRGAADIGISGRDSLVEADFPLLQLADLKFGACEFVVAAPAALDCSLEELSLRLGTIRVATKYPRLTQGFFDARGIQVEIVKLNGNIELAPLIGIADLVVDITQTGTTLRENNMRILETVLPSTAHFVAQYSSARCDTRVLELANRLEKTLTIKEDV